MSTATEIARLQAARNLIRNKLVNLGLATSTDLLDDLADEIDAYLAQDLALFQKWLSARKVFESCLNKKVRVIFSSQTGYWLDLYLSTLKGEFID